MEAALENGAVAVRRVCEADAAAARRPLRADGSTPAHVAAEGGRYHILLVLAKAGADADASNEAGVTPLQLALQAQWLMASATLLTLGVDVQAHVGDLEWTPLHVAAWAGDDAAVGTLALDRASLTVASCLGWTPLHVAALGGHVRVVRTLVESGADVAVAGAKGWMPLHHAAWGGHADVVGLLVDRGSDVAACDKNGWTALHFAARYGHADVVGLLVDRGSDVAAGNEAGWTALHCAANTGHADVAGLLVDRGSDVAARNKSGWTPLYLAARAGHADLVGLLVDRGSDVAAANKVGVTALHLAAACGHADVVGLLLSKGSDVAAVTSNGETALHKAARAGHADVVGLLVDRGSDVAAGDKDGWTALHCAASTGHADVVGLLVDRGSDVAAGNKVGVTALHSAAACGHADVVGLLLSKGSDVAAVTSNGETALHTAARAGHADVVGLLVDRGSDVAAASKGGRSPLHCAAQAGHADAAEVLLKSGAAVDGTVGESPLTCALRFGVADGVLSVLLVWGAKVPSRLRPLAARARVSSSAKRLLLLSDATPRMTEQQREDAKAEWRAGNARRVATVATPTAADRALAQLQETLDGFLSTPASLSLDALDRAVTTSLIKDVRCLRTAHQLLLFAARRGLFAQESAAEASLRHQDFYDRIYAPAIEQLKGGDGPVAAAIVHDAVCQGLVSSTHRSIMQTGLHLHASLYRELQQVNRRLNSLEQTAKNTGKVLSNTIDELRGLQQYLLNKDERERKMALAKSFIKLGLSLAPIVGGALNVGVDAAVTLAESSSGAAVVYKCLAVPSDIEAARQVLRCVASAQDSLSSEQQEQVQAVVDQLAPYQSLEEVDRDLGWAVQVLEVDKGAVHVLDADAGAVQVPAVEAGGAEVGDTVAAADASGDEWDKPKEVATDLLVDRAVDMVADRGRSQPAPRPVAHPSEALAGPSRARDSSSAARPPSLDHQQPPSQLATATQSLAGTDGPLYGRAFFADLLDWDGAALVAKLVDYVGRTYPPAKRAEFKDVVRVGVEKHMIDGPSIFRCEDPMEMAAFLLGDWKCVHGASVSVRSFVADAKQFAC